MKIKNLLVFLFFLCSTCLFSKPLIDGYSNKNEIPETSKTAMEIMDQTIQSLSLKYNIHACGFGMDEDKGFTYLEITFEVFRPLERDKARIMLIDCLDVFLKNINTNEKIKPHLKTHPFTFKNVGIVFYIADANNRDLVHPDICVAAARSSGIYYRTNDPETGRYKEKYEETHEEALALIKKQLATRLQNKNE